MTGADLRVLVDSKFLTFVATNSMQPTLLEIHIIWKLEVGNFLPIFSPVQLFGTVGNTTICRHILKFGALRIKRPFFLGPTSLVFARVATSPFSFCIGCMAKMNDQIPKERLGTSRLNDIFFNPPNMTPPQYFRNEQLALTDSCKAK